MEEKKDKRKIDVFKEFFKTDLKMKSLILYVFFNIMHIFIHSFLIITQKSSIENLAKCYIPFLIINFCIGIVIIVKKKYKKDWLHFWIGLIILFRNNFNNICY